MKKKLIKLESSMRGYVALAVLLVAPMFAMAESGRTVEGMVTTFDKQPLDGVTIVVGQTEQEVETDYEGKYEVEVPKGATLSFFYPDYTSIEIEPTKKVLNVILLELAEDQDETVVVPYGQQNKRDVLGSISSVKGDELVGSSGCDFKTALQGAVPGVQVSKTGAGGDPSVTIRGVRSLYSGSEPLWVIDGMIADGNEVNENDIYSIEVLKDASSTSFYGSRGANGVIVITTKAAHAAAELRKEQRQKAKEAKKNKR